MGAHLLAWIAAVAALSTLACSGASSGGPASETPGPGGGGTTGEPPGGGGTGGSTGGSGNGLETASACDPGRRRIFLFGGYGDASDYYDMATNTMHHVAVGGALGHGVGLAYDPALDAYLVRRDSAGGAITAIDAETFEARELATTGGEAIPEAVNGVWRRFLHVPRLGGVVYYPHHDPNLWFLRTE